MEKYTRGQQQERAVKSSSSSFLEFFSIIIIGFATIVQCSIFNLNSENLLVQGREIDQDNLKSKFGSHKIRIPVFTEHLCGLYLRFFLTPCGRNHFILAALVRILRTKYSPPFELTLNSD